MVWHFHVAATAMAAFAVGSAVLAFPQRGRARDVTRRSLLISGVCAMLATLILVGHPELRDLLQLQIWTVAVIGFAAGALRGATMHMTPDQLLGIVRLRHGSDGFWMAALLAVFAVVQYATELWLDADNPHEATSEFAMILTSGFLLARAVVAWKRVGSLPHFDLRD